MQPPDPKIIESILERAWQVPPSAREAFVKAESGGDVALAEAVLGRLHSSPPGADLDATIDLPLTPDADVTIDLPLTPDAEATIDLPLTPDADATIDLPLEGSDEASLDVGDGERAKTVAIDKSGSDRSFRNLPDQIADFKIIKMIGSGGMGEVYLAEQMHPRRKVALKVIRATIASVDALQRFEVEGHTLARLSHPGIAQVFAAGIHNEGGVGIPFFAMEYVGNAQPLTVWADSQHLDERQRLQLFHEVCESIGHGHQRGIIHLDLKPGNILVNEEGESKIIDFGVAQMEEEGAETAQRRRQIVGTLQYMPPEQVKGDPDIDTSCDVYALGVVLYELLTGSVPYEIDTSSVAAATTSIVNAATPSLLQVQPALGRDLDAIVGKSLAKDRKQRYRSAAELGDDVARFLADEPIQAREQTTGEAIRRFMRKHRAATFAIVTISIVVLVGLVAVSVFAYRTEIARAEEQRQRGIADEALERVEAERLRLGKIVAFQSDMLKNLKPVEMGRSLRAGILKNARDRLRADGVPADLIEENMQAKQHFVDSFNPTEVAVGLIHEQLLKRALAAIPEQFADDRETEAGVREIVADAYEELGRFALASPEYEKALAIRMELFGPDDSRTLESTSDLGLLRYAEAREDDARELLERALSGRRKVLGDEHPETIASIQNLGSLVYRSNDLERAEELWKEALELSMTVNGDLHPVTVTLVGNLGALCMDLGRLEEAQHFIQQDYDFSVRVYGEHHPEALAVKRNLANLAMTRGDFEEALRLQQEAMEGYRKAVGDRHPETLATMASIGSLLVQSDRAQEGAALLQRAYQGRLETLGEDHPDTFLSLQMAAEGYLFADRLDLAAPYVQAAYDGSLARHGDASPQALMWALRWGLVLIDLDRFAESEVVVEQLNSTCSNFESTQQPPICQNVPGVFVRLYTAWDESEPGAGHDERAAHWQRIIDAASPPAP